MTAPKQKFYDIVAEEIRSRFVVDGLWVRSFSEAGGDETKAKAIYISYRVEQLQAEEAAARATAFERAQAEARREHDQRESPKRQARDKCARELEAERQRPLDPKAKRFLIVLLLVALGLFFLLILPLLSR